jgi:hypothetical protein
MWLDADLSTWALISDVLRGLERDVQCREMAAMNT